MPSDGATTPDTNPPESIARPPRRDLLSWLLGGWATGVLGAIVYPIGRFLVPPEIPESRTLSATAGKASDLLPNSARLVPFGSGPALVIRLASGELRAFTGQCTHLSCTVQYRSDLQQIWCACHNGIYDLNGRNVSGPPPKPLRAFDVSVKGDEITVSRSS